MKLNSRGESLLTVMIAIGLTALVASAALSMYTNLMKQQKTVMTRGSMQSLVDELRLALSNGDTCKVNLQNQIFSNSSPILNIQKIMFLNASGVSLSTKAIVSTLTPAGGVKVQSITLEDRQLISSTLFLAKLKLVMEGSGLIGVNTIIRSFPILVATDTNGLITNCRTMGFTGMETLPQNSVDCVAKYGSGWYFQNGACLPPNSIPTNTTDCSLKYGSGWTYTNGTCIPPSIKPTSNSDCESVYGTGWYYQNGTCVPPSGASCSAIVNKKGYTLVPSANHGQIVNGTLQTPQSPGVPCPTNCNCVYNYQCFNGSFQFVSWYVTSCVDSPN